MYKIVEWQEEGRSGARSELLDVFHVTAPEPVRRMAISRRVSRGQGSPGRGRKQGFGEVGCERETSMVLEAGLLCGVWV